MGKCFGQTTPAQQYRKRQQFNSPTINDQKMTPDRHTESCFLKAVLAGPVDISHGEFPHSCSAGKDGCHDKRHGILITNPFNFKRTRDKGKMMDAPLLLFCLATATWGLHYPHAHPLLGNSRPNSEMIQF